MKKVYVVAHSHWDREWYFTIEDSNNLLYLNIAHLLQLLEHDQTFTSYTFDGQVSILEDYLKMYPEDENRIRNLIQTKRLFVGPWYTQTDTLIVSVESIIRNLLYGKKIAMQFGHSMDVGYLPDVFGQNAYLPSIFKQMGITYSILQRGIHMDDLKHDVNFLWQSPDGASIKANYMYFGYGPGKFLSANKKYYHETLVPILEKLVQYNRNSDALLLPAGGDQVLVREHFPKTIQSLNRNQHQYKFILSDYETFMKVNWKESFHNIIYGELDCPQRSRVHITIKSQRYDIKKLNYQVERMILDILEPLAVLADTLTIRYPYTIIQDIWKNVFDAQSHDSLGGCNSDETNQEVIHRLNKCKRIIEGQIHLLKRQIACAIENAHNKPNLLVLFQTNLTDIQAFVKAVVFTKTKSFTLMDENQTMIEHDVLNQQNIEGGTKVIVTADGEKQSKLPDYYRSEILIKNPMKAGLGYKVLFMDEAIQETVQTKTSTEIENQTYRIFIEADTLILECKGTKKRFENIFIFEDCEDCGDSYDFSYGMPKQQVRSHKIVNVKQYRSKFTQKMEIEYEVETFSKEKISCITTLTLVSKSASIHVTHKLTNHVKNHRLQVLFVCPFTFTNSYADQGFSFLQRDNQRKDSENWRTLQYAEAPLPIYTMENMMYVQDEINIFAVLSKGLKEYEIVDHKTIALTLFRSVGILGKDDLLIRPGRASGINNKVVYTPAAQMQQTMEFEYAIIYGKYNETQLYDTLMQYRNYSTCYQVQNLNVFEERLERFEIPKIRANKKLEHYAIKLDKKGIYQSVCKLAYEQDGIIVRLFNPSKTAIKLPTNDTLVMSECNLYEEEQVTCKEFEIEPRGYTTIKIKNRGN